MSIGIKAANRIRRISLRSFAGLYLKATIYNDDSANDPEDLSSYTAFAKIIDETGATVFTLSPTTGGTDGTFLFNEVLPSTITPGWYRWVGGVTDSSGEEDVRYEGPIHIQSHILIVGGEVDANAWAAVLSSRFDNNNTIANAATFVAYDSAGVVDDTASTTSGTVDWTEDSAGTNEWNGGNTGIKFLKDPFGGNNGKAKRITVSGLTEGQKYSVWCCLLDDPIAPATDMGCLIGKVSRGGTNDLWYFYFGETTDANDHRIVTVADGNIAGTAGAPSKMVFVDNMVADKGGQITYVLEDYSGAGSDRVYFAGTAYGDPLSDDDESTHVPVAQVGVWSWFGDPRAIVLADGTYLIGTVDAGGSATAVYFNPSTNAQTEVNLSSWQEIDDHNGPAFVETDDSKVVAAYAKHSRETKVYTRKSTAASPTADGDWAAEASTSTTAKATYAMLFKTSNGDLHHFFRQQNREWSYRKSTDDGATWGSIQSFMDHSTTTFPPYMKVAMKDDVFWCLASEAPNVNESDVWCWQFDGTNFKDADGTQVKTLASGKLLVDTELGASSTVYTHDDTYGGAWISTLAVDSDGYPRVLFTTFDLVNSYGSLTRDDGDKIRAWYGRWDGSSWSTTPVAFLGRGIHAGNSLYSAETAIDPNDPDQIFVATNAHRPFDLNVSYSLSARSPHELWQGNRIGTGLDFYWSRVTVGTNPLHCNFRPFVATNAAGTTSILFWLKGIYGNDGSSYNGYSMAYGSTDFEVMSKVIVSSGVSAASSQISAPGGGGVRAPGGGIVNPPGS